jgi:hypothetical protein
MAVDEAEAWSFAQSQILMEEFGSEAQFNALMADEAKALLSPDSIVDFLKNKLEELARGGGGAALKWVSGSLLRVLGRGGAPSDLEQIKAMLNTILAQQKVILDKLDDLLIEVKFQHLITRGYPSVQQIDNLHKQLQHLSNVRDPDERKRRAAELRAAITDVNGGTTASLKIISDVLLGRDPMGPSDPLIRLFTSRWQPIFLGRQLGQDVPLSTYWRRLDEWLHGLFVVQYVGLSQLANARVAAGDFETLEQEIADTVQNMTAQQAMLNEVIPKWTRTLPASVMDGRWYVIQGPHTHNRRWDTSQVLYGSPGRGTYLDYSVTYRTRNNRNGDEEWIFDKTGPNDAFVLRQRSRPRGLAHINGVSVQPQGWPVRIVMAPVKGRVGWGVEPYVPALGFVGTGWYLFWERKGPNRVRVGTLDQASIIAIVPAGH